MAEVRVGVLGSAEVNGPIANPTSKWSLGDASTWALILFGVAVLYVVVM